MHFDHRFILKQVGANVTVLSETESLQSHRWVLLLERTGFRPHELRRNTKAYHGALFRNIKAALEGGSAAII